MTLTVSTSVYREAAARASHIAHGCRWWIVQVRVVLLGQQSHPLAAAVERVSAVADRMELLARELSLLADKYDDHESRAARILEPLSFAGLAMALGPWLPLGLGTLTALISTGVICRDGPARMSRTLELETSSPTGVDGVLARIPQGADQVRIDALESNGRTRYVVYVSGTRDFSPVATTQPWDLTSGFTSLRGEQQSACERAVRAAMAEAGIDANDDVTLVGHSLGGVVAMRIAESGDFAVSDVVTAGAPIHPMTLGSSTRVTAIEHTDDLVPAVSGAALATTAVVVRSRFAHTQTSTWDAHALTAYRATAREIDASRDPALADRRARILEPMRAEKVTSRWYRATRN